MQWSTPSAAKGLPPAAAGLAGSAARARSTGRGHNDAAAPTRRGDRLAGRQPGPRQPIVTGRPRPQGSAELGERQQA